MDQMSATTNVQVILIGVQLPGVPDGEHHSSLNELKRLVETLGYTVNHIFTQKRPKLETATVVGEGKLEEIKSLVLDQMESEKDKGVPEKATSALLIFDNDLTPTQMRNLMKHTEAEVLDRTAVILEIFNRHAKTREARLQVEIARLSYLSPRIREAGASDRQRGGIGGRGVGETAHELDKRRIRDRISQLKRELETIHGDQGVRRLARQGQPRVALVGYTNAGKSSLMRQLTSSEVYVADKLFATLDTTVRSLYPEGPLRILVSDTVGFIKKLPHDLVASFRSTLDEALDSSLLLFVVDASDPTFLSQLEVAREVIGPLAIEQSAKVVLNKWDLVSEERRAELRRDFPDAIPISTRSANDIALMHKFITDFFERDWELSEVFIPYEKSALLPKIRTEAHLIEELSLDQGLKVKFKASPQFLKQISAALE